MINITVDNADNVESVVQAYAASVTETINAYKTLSFSFAAVGQNKVAENLLGPETKFTLSDGRMFHLTTSNPQPTARFRVYTITATEVGQDIADIYVRDSIKGSQSLDDCLKLLTNGSNISYKIDGNVGNHDFGDNELGKGSGGDVLNAIAEAFGIEYYFDNYTLHVAKSIGKPDSFVFVDRVNASLISWNEDYSNFKTAIHGFGKEIEQEDSGGRSGGDSGVVASYARQFAGRPYVWGGSSPSGWDCSGFVAYIFNHFGVPMRQPTTYEEYQGQVVSPPYQEGDMLFWGPRGNAYHVALALDSNTLIMAANPERGTVIQAISAWQPAFGVRNAAMAAKVAGSSDSSDTTNDTPQYTCQADYFSPLASMPGIGKRWASDFSSNTITDENTLKAALKKELHDYPDVQYSVDWVTFKNQGNIMNNIAIGNQGYLRDRYGTDVNVKIQSFTRYLDEESSNSSSITFGNKIFDSALYDSRSKQANSDQQQQAQVTVQQSTGGSAYTTMTSEEVEKLANFFNG